MTRKCFPDVLPFVAYVFYLCLLFLFVLVVLGLPASFLENMMSIINIINA